MTDDAPPTAPDEAPKPADQATAAPADAPAAEAPAPPSTMSTADAAPQAAAGPYRTAPAHEAPPAFRPNYVFLAVVSLISLVLDLGSKAWAKSRLEDPVAFADRNIEVIKDHLAFRFARNQGGAWGLLQDEPESIRRPFFLGISFLAIVFIVSLYRKLTPQQWALKWGLPLVLGGALGNLVNRIQYNYVVDFIDYRASWVKAINGMMSSRPNDHWPTFNIADVAIVAGVILMAVDMFTPRKPALATVAGEASPSSAASAVASSEPTAPASDTAAEPVPTGKTPAPMGETPMPPVHPAPKET